MSASNVTRFRPPARPSVLVVEHDVLTRFMLADALRAGGFKVLEASTAEDAVTILESLPVHLVFTELCIAGRRSGPAVAQAARARRPPPHVIVTSGRVGADDIPDLGEIVALVPKPYVISHVVDLVARTLDPTADG